MKEQDGLAEACVRGILRRPRLCAAALLLPLVAAWGTYAYRAGPRLGELPVNNNLEVWFGAEDPALVAYQDFQAEFGNDETIVIALRAEPHVFQPSFLHRPCDEVADTMQHGLNKLPELSSMVSRRFDAEL